MNAGTASRRAAVFALTRWLATQEFPDRLIPDGPDHGFVMDLVFGCVRGWRALEWVLSQCVTRMPDGETHAALLVGACQVLWMPEIPEYAALHATVEAAKLASRRSAGFVNGTLRTLVRQRETLLAALEQQPVGVRLSHPDLLVARWTARWGATETEALCRLDNTPAATVLACLPGRLDADALDARLAAGGVHTTPHPAHPLCRVLPHGVRVADLPGYAEGLFTVQDPATLAAVDLLEIAPGQRVLDACAAPGGKTVQIAARLGGTGRLVAMDRHADRLRTLQINLARFGFDQVERVCGDAAAAGPDAALPAGETFDRILLDVPCTNTGVFRRRPDARWRFSVQRLAQLTATQFGLLQAGFRRLEVGGRLVYSTCSLEPEENQQVVDRLLAAEPAARLLAVVDRLPTRDATDGAFAAAITRVVP